MVSSESLFSAKALKDAARKDLVRLLDSVQGKKSLVIDPSVSGPLSLIAEFSLLKEHGVDKIYHLQPTPADTGDARCLIYLCRPTLRNMQWIASQVQQNASNGKRIEYQLLFVPRRSVICEKLLEDEGVLGEIHIGEYELDIVPLDEDVLSLEVESAFKDIYVDGDTSCIYSLARALMKLQCMFGLIPRIVGKGAKAQMLFDLLMRMRRQLTATAAWKNVHDPFPSYCEFDSVLILDRSVDLITPMCTQLTYEGLIDEIFGIRTTFAEFDSSVLPSTAAPSTGSTSAGPSSSASAPPAQAPTKPRKVPLNSTDSIYQQLRDSNFTIVNGTLSQLAKRIHGDYEERHKAQTVTQIKNFIGKLGTLQVEHQSLRLHINVAERITKYTQDVQFNRRLDAEQSLVANLSQGIQLEYIEELICKQAPLSFTIRLLCLYSLVNGGVKPKHLDHLQREIVQTYGIEHLLTLQNLEKAGLLTRLESQKNGYPSIRKSLRLIVDDVDEQSPNDISFVYSGYAPISIRLVQVATTKSVGASSAPIHTATGVASAVASAAVSVTKNAAAVVTGASSITTTTTSTTTVTPATTINGNPAPSGGSGSANGSGSGPSHAVPGTATVVNQTVGWKGCDELIRAVPGATLEEVQIAKPGLLPARLKSQQKITLVVFIGGCTSTEISALRFLARNDPAGREYVVLTTHVLNGTRMISELSEKVDRS
ncbi:Sec1-like protein [Polychytrium aggregatum]|uniref:Sec1-like protein n=1 Tax=Polychytrium aggregatum TaxID=110093 RepID=UPI0022FF4294|nr:Sec1-like protein [Polychytrium aggregatum]KAI9202754.1 Sec1-like protein [Polychytrium aggregatum]